MERAKDAEVVSAYLRNTLVSNMKKALPGLYMYFNSLAYERYGMSLENLFWNKPEEFVNIFKDYFRSKEIAYSVLEALLKPLAKKSEGREALKKILDGDSKGFKEVAIKALSKEAEKWYKEVVEAD